MVVYANEGKSHELMGPGIGGPISQWPPSSVQGTMVGFEAGMQLTGLLQESSLANISFQTRSTVSLV